MDEGEIYQDDQVMFFWKTTSDATEFFTILNKRRSFIGYAAIIYVALVTSLPHHLMHVWFSSGNFLQQQWDNILNTFGDDPFILFVYGTTIITTLLYWIVGGLYTIMDVFNAPTFLRRYKMQPGTNEPVDNYTLMKCILLVNFNQIVIGIPFSIIAHYFMTLRGYDQSPQLPTFGWLLIQLIGFILLMEFGFYYSHRMLHHRLFYKRFHKTHHEWQSPIALSALYVHPFEHVLSSIVPAMLGPLVFGCHTATLWLWVSMLYLSTMNAHSGYHLPFLPSPEAHDFHHLNFNQCYGVLGILDLLHGTDEKFQSSKKYSRHFMMLSLTQSRVLFPDVTKVKKL